MSKNQEYLNPLNVAGIGNLELVARLVVEGFITGLHKSPYHGFSVEFSEHRAYRPGDEVKNIDWKVYARSNRYYVKQYEEETNLRAMIIVDSSASMKYKSKGHISKYDYAKFLASALAYLMNKQRDATGLSIFDTEIRTYLPSRSKKSYIGELLKALDNTEPRNQTGTSKALGSLAERIKRRGLVVIISDFFDDPQSVNSALKHFRHKGHEVIVFQILDPREIDFKLGQGATFIDLETQEEMLTQPHQLQKAYKENMEEFLNSIKSECHRQNVDYHLITTDTTFDKALIGYLAKRRKI